MKSRIFLIVVSLFLWSGVHAQPLPTPPPIYAPTTGVVASPGAETDAIVRASIVSQRDRTLNISFDSTNGAEERPRIGYVVQLMEVTAATTNALESFMADEQMFLVHMTLKVHATAHEQITYVAPASLQGMYEVYLRSIDQTGSPLATKDLGLVRFAPPTSGVGIDLGSCVLDVRDLHGSSATSTVFDGVTLKEGHALFLDCDVLNYGTATTSFTPQYVTHESAVLGVMTPQVGGDTASRLLGPHGRQSFSFAVPRTPGPGAYETTFSLSSGGMRSNIVFVRYFVQGADAAVQNITLDKDQYAQGDTAQVGFQWSPAVVSAGTSTSPVIELVDISLQDGMGEACAAVSKQQTPSGTPEEVRLSIVRACTEPHVIVQVVYSDGAVLATGNLVVTTKRTHVFEGSITALLGIVSALLAVGGVLMAVFLWHVKRRGTAQATESPSSAPPVRPR